MKKKIVKVVKMELPGGDAHPGPKLASAGVNMAKFCTDFNAKTGDRRGQIVPVIITAYEDKSCDFVIKTSPVAGLILKAAGIEKGSGNPKNIATSSRPSWKKSPTTSFLTSTARTSKPLRKSLLVAAVRWASPSTN